MLYIALVLLLVSLDAFFVGAVFGIRGIRLPADAAAVIFAVTLAMVFTVSLLGGGIVSVLPEAVGNAVSAAIFILIGVFMLLESLMKVKDSDRLSLRLHPLHMVVTVVREPDKADLDDSRVIDRIEALYIGTAVSVDASAASAALFADGGNPFLLAPAVALITTALVLAGCLLGKALNLSRFSRVGIFAGSFMILLGIFRLV